MVIPSRFTDRKIVYFAGEIFNLPRMRVLLERQGYRFAHKNPYSDREIILAVLDSWGADALKEFNGSFAIVIRDSKTGDFFIARDRFGIEPLYYRMTKSTLYYGADVKTVLELVNQSPEIDLEGLFEYLSFQNFLTDHTLYTGVKLFPPAHYATVSWANEEHEPVIAPVAYWEFNPIEPRVALGIDEYISQIDSLLRLAVERRSSGGAGVWLSSGVDSSMITHYAQPDYAFTCGFMESQANERLVAESTAKKHDCEHYEMVLKASDIGTSLSRIVEILEEPRGGQWYPNYYMARLAGKFCDTVLLGDGGDEIFGGYPWRYETAKGIEPPFDLAELIKFNNETFDRYHRLFDSSSMAELFGWPSGKTLHLQADIYMKVDANKTDYLPLHEVWKMDVRLGLHGLLVGDYKLCKAHGLKMRVPYLDNDVVDFMTTFVPDKLKWDGEQGKVLLRKLMAKYYPPVMASLRKQGFSAPDEQWYRELEWVKKTLFNNKAKIFRFLNPDVVLPLLKDHFSGKANRRHLVWSLLYLEEWCSQNKI